MKRYLYYIKNYIFSFLYDLRIAFTEGIYKRISAQNYHGYRYAKRYPDYLKYGAGLETIHGLAKQCCKGKGLDIGSGKWPLDGARAIENRNEENAYKVLEPDASQDFVFSSHVLEHLEKPEQALAEWWRVLKKGGVLFLYLPHPACKMWDYEIFSHHVWHPDPESVRDMVLAPTDAEMVEISVIPDIYFSFHIIARKKK